MRKSTFSLIELLIVVSVIAAMVSLLQPSLKNVFIQARLIKCSHNLKMIGVGHQNYSEDNEGYFHSTDFRNSLIAERYKFHGKSVPQKFQYSDEEPGYMEPYLGNRFTSTYSCPGFDFDETSPYYDEVKDDGKQTYRGFRSFNSAITKIDDFVFPQFNVGSPGPGFLANKSVKPITWDFLSNVPDSYWYNIGDSVVHGNTGFVPVLFSDGHVNINCFFPLTEWSKHNWQYNESYFLDWY